MKKHSFLYIPVFFGLLLTGCKNDEKIVQTNTVNNPTPSLAEDNKNENAADSPKETVSLTASNFSTYVAINSIAVLVNSATHDVAYYSYFIGADYCKFINCTVTYKYNGSGEASTVSLTLSGDGQADPFIVPNQTTHALYVLSVTGASGTVEVYR